MSLDDSMVRDVCFGTVVVLCAFFGLSSAIGCIGSNGMSVDWFVAYKLPKIADSPNGFVRAGVAHIYLDAVNPKWVFSDTPVNVSSQAMGFTLNQIYKGAQQDDIAYLMYNDEIPEGSKFEYLNRGHLKDAGNQTVDAMQLATTHISGYTRGGGRNQLSDSASPLSLFSFVTVSFCARSCAVAPNEG